MFKRVIFNLTRKVYKYVLKKDDMEVIIKYYRLSGAKIGNNVRAFSPIISAEPYLIEVGNNVTISTGVFFTTHDNSVSKVIKNSTDIFGRIRIGDNCFVGQNSIILPGVIIADNTIIGAGSVVTKSFKQGNQVIAGNPAKVICTLSEFKEKVKDNTFDTREKNYNEKYDYLLKNEEKFILK